MAGRPQHGLWSDRGFKLVKEKNKCAAFCTICQKTLKNTAAKRLESHRNVCRFPSSIATLPFGQPKVTSTPKRRYAVTDSSEEAADDLSLATPSEFENPSHGGSGGSSRPCSSALSNNLSTLDFASTSKENLTISNSDSADNNVQQDLEHSSVNVDLEYEKPNAMVSKSWFNTGKLAFVDQMSKAENEAANRALGKFVFGCNIPLSVVESNHFKNFVKTLRPSYRPPVRKTLATTILDKEYEECRTSLHFGLHSVLLIDGWKNEAANTKNVAAMIHNAAGEVGFLNAWDLSGEKETGDALKDIVSQAVVDAKDMYNSELYAVCSDNAANMMKMGKIIDLWHITCNSHTANLLAKELVSATLASRVNTVLKAFTSADQEVRLLAFGGHRITLACDTRWCSNRDAFLCLKKNLPAMKKVVGQGITIEHTALKLIFDDNFMKQVDDGIKLFDPVCTLINNCQQTKFSIADAAEEWFQLKLPDGYPELEEKVEKRREYALTTYGLAANFLHPTYRGKRLSTGQRDEVEEFLLHQLDGDGLEDLAKFNSATEDSIFRVLRNKGVRSPSTFWELAKRKHPGLSNLADKLLNVPASSAQLERVFSNWSYVHCPLRNRLTFERSKKLLHVYHTLKLKDVKSDEY